MTEQDRNGLRQRAMERVLQRYSWDAVTADYDRLFQKLAPRHTLRAGRRLGVDN
jgi:glycosyltransferase involved in cell wall biosynthesis